MTRRIGRYELLRPIASGGMARVYLGRAHADVEGFERLVAIKVMHAHVAESAEHVAMFLDEAKLAARIRHPNVVATLDIVRDAKVPFIVMEFIEGPSLHHLLKLVRTQQQTLPVDVTCRVFNDLLTGLHAAHELTGPDGSPLHLVHRDVSPQNVLVGSDGITRLTDFGVARAEMRISETRAGQLKGKIRYMPPEQIRGTEIDRRADVYAAGVVLWEVLVGRRLFSAKSEGELVLKLVEGAKESPRQANTAVPEAIDKVCMQALALAPADRFPTAAALAEALESASLAERIPVASSRRLAAYIEGLEGIHGAPDPSGIRWLPSAPSVGGTPSGMSLYSRHMMRPAISSSDGPLAPAAPPPLPSGSSSGVAAAPSFPSGMTPSGIGSGVGPSARSEDSSTGSITSPTDAALLAAMAPLAGDRRKWLLPALATAAAVVAAAGVWTALGTRGPTQVAPATGGGSSVGAASGAVAGSGADERTAVPDEVREGERQGGSGGEGADADATSKPATSAKATGHSKSIQHHAPTGHGAHTAAPHSTASKGTPTPTHTAHHPPPPHPTPTTTTTPHSYHPDDL